MRDGVYVAASTVIVWLAYVPVVTAKPLGVAVNVLVGVRLATPGISVGITRLV